MDRKTLTELDYFRIRDIISGFCAAEESRFVMGRLEPLSDAEEIEKLKEISREWMKYLGTTRAPAVSGWNPVFNIIKSLKVQGISLPLASFYDLGTFCCCVEKMRQAVFSAEKELGLKNLAECAGSIPDISFVREEIFRIITNDGEMRDLPALREIRSKISNLNAKIKGVMHSFTSNSKYSDVLESNVPVLRGGRQVLAVKSNRRNSVPGIIHEVSQTGLTVYIEPDEAVIASNELIEAEFELQAEIRKILVELAEKISPYSEDLKNALKIMEKMDIAHAAASWGKQNSCVFAKKNTSQSEPLCILKARHPLLGEKAIPVDVKFLPGKRILIITGPNTGGKTVTLKTIALFALLNQSGFPVPAEEGTVLPVFSNVFADIGDEQSMDESLSTFSGHMKNIAKAVCNVNENSLVLLDELGSGTDPQEGAAISMAVLDRLIEKKAFVLITTHQGVIKNYGYTHPECINASVEFNTETLSPTYRLLMGIPGESHALDIAKRSGLPAEIVKNAREYILNEKADVSSLIKGLTKKHAELDALYSELEEKQACLEEKMFIQEQKKLELEKKEFELKQGIQQESQVFLEESRKKLENLVRIVKEGELNREKTLSVKAFIKDITEKVAENEEALLKEEEILEEKTAELLKKEKNRVSHKSKKKKTKLADALKSATSMAVPKEEKDKSGQKEVSLEIPQFAVGANVLAGKSRQQGTIIKSRGKGLWEVQFGSIKMTMKQKDLTLTSSPKVRTPSYTVDLASGGKENRPAYELRLLGLRAEEAVKALERQIDLCTLSNLKNFSIIHGNGNGILRQTVQDYLSNCPTVQDFSFARPEDGGFGKTYVTLR